MNDIWLVRGCLLWVNPERDFCLEPEEDFLEIYDPSVSDFDVFLSQQQCLLFHSLSRGLSPKTSNSPVRSHYSVAWDSGSIGILAASIPNSSVCLRIQFPSDLTVSRDIASRNPLHEFPNSLVEVHAQDHLLLIITASHRRWSEIKTVAALSGSSGNGSDRYAEAGNFRCPARMYFNFRLVSCNQSLPLASSPRKGDWIHHRENPIADPRALTMIP